MAIDQKQEIICLLEPPAYSTEVKCSFWQNRENRGQWGLYGLLGHLPYARRIKFMPNSHVATTLAEATNNNFDIRKPRLPSLDKEESKCTLYMDTKVPQIYYTKVPQSKISLRFAP